MDYARELQTGEIVAAEVASSFRDYVCPRPGCGGPVYLPNVRIQRPHFRHCPGYGTPECELYNPGCGERDSSPCSTIVVDEAYEFGLILQQVDYEWGIFLRLPEIPKVEFGCASLTDLQKAFLEVTAGEEHLTRVSALELRPGIGAHRVKVPPSVYPYLCEPVGHWPDGIAIDRWKQVALGVPDVGGIFRLRCGEWVRVKPDSGVHWGDELLVLTDARLPPPPTANAERYYDFQSSRVNWTLWYVRLPSESVSDLPAWLSLLGQTIVPRPWKIRLANPPRKRTSTNVPVFFLGDKLVIELESPYRHAETMGTIQLGSNSQSVTIKTADDCAAYVAVSSEVARSGRFFLAGERNAGIDILFEQSPTAANVLDDLTLTSRLRIWIDEQLIEAFRQHSRAIRVFPNSPPNVRIETGIEDSRVALTIWGDGKRRHYRQLHIREAQSKISDSISNSTRVEIDAAGLGFIAFDVNSQKRSHSYAQGRLYWWDYVQGVSEDGKRRFVSIESTPTAAGVSRIEETSAAGLVRSRLNNRRIRGSGRNH